MEIVAIVSLVIALGITYLTVRATTVKAMQKGKEYWLKIGLFYLLMALGMLAREGYNALVNGKPFNWTSLAVAAIVSPMIFGGIYGSLGNLPIDVLSVVLAFQNGFFWNTIFEGLGPTT